MAPKFNSNAKQIGILTNTRNYDKQSQKTLASSSFFLKKVDVLLFRKNRCGPKIFVTYDTLNLVSLQQFYKSMSKRVSFNNAKLQASPAVTPFLGPDEALIGTQTGQPLMDHTFDIATINIDPAQHTLKTSFL